MYELVSKLLVYRNIGKESILFKLSEIIKDFDDGEYDRNELRSRILDEVHELLNLATEYGFDKNLWRDYIAYLIAMTENPFTIVSEKRGKTKGSVNSFVKSDMSVFRQLMEYDFEKLENELSLDCFSLITHYDSVKKEDRFINKNASIRIRELSDRLSLAKNDDEFFEEVISFYGKYGVGMFGMNRAFRVSQKGDSILVPIAATSTVTLSDLFGYESQKEALIKNTESFLNGNSANNVLLYGDAGTGKSTSVKALLNLYYESGLRIIEVYKHEFKYLPEIISIIKNRNYRFIIYMDDLSFESAETEYKYLKAVIEGDLEVKPENVLIYATSNRKHLIRESFADRKETDDDDIHKNDTIAERMSLSDRFGLTISYFKPERKEFYGIVKSLYKKDLKNGNMTDEELFLEADRFAMRNGGMSGRTAQQFVDYLVSLS